MRKLTTGRFNRQEEPEPSFFGQRWKNVEHVVGLLIEDGIVYIAFVLILTIGYAAIGVWAGTGYPPERIEMFETLHFYAFLAAFGLILVSFVIRVAFFTFRKMP